MGHKIKTALITSAIMALFVVGIAFATPITVDGNPSDWLPGALLGQTTTNTGSPVDSEASIQAVYFTNDTSKMYWRLETTSITDWSNAGMIAICLSTEAEADAVFGPCTSDYTLVLDPGLGTATLVDNSASHTDTTLGIEVAVDGTTTEISILLANVAITPANCAAGCTIGAGIVVDAAGVDGSMGVDFTNTAFTTAPQVGQGSPTSVTVLNFTAEVSPLQEQSNWALVWIVSALLVALVVVIIWRQVMLKKAG